MADPHPQDTLAQFEARIQRTKNRLVAIPADIQRQLGLERQGNNHVIYVSIRPAGSGRWNRHWLKLTHDNEFTIPKDVVHLRPGDAVEVKVHRMIPDAPVRTKVAGSASATGLLLELARRSRPGWRTDGSAQVDEYLNEAMRDQNRVR